MAYGRMIPKLNNTAAGSYFVFPEKTESADYHGGYLAKKKIKSSSKLLDMMSAVII